MGVREILHYPKKKKKGTRFTRVCVRLFSPSSSSSTSFFVWSKIIFLHTKFIEKKERKKCFKKKKLFSLINDCSLYVYFPSFPRLDSRCDNHEKEIFFFWRLQMLFNSSAPILSFSLSLFLSLISLYFSFFFSFIHSWKCENIEKIAYDK